MQNVSLYFKRKFPEKNSNNILNIVMIKNIDWKIFFYMHLYPFDDYEYKFLNSSVNFTYQWTLYDNALNIFWKLQKPAVMLYMIKIKDTIQSSLHITSYFHYFLRIYDLAQ